MNIKQAMRAKAFVVGERSLLEWQEDRNRRWLLGLLAAAERDGLIWVDYFQSPWFSDVEDERLAILGERRLLELEERRRALEAIAKQGRALKNRLAREEAARHRSYLKRRVVDDKVFRARSLHLWNADVTGSLAVQRMHARNTAPAWPTDTEGEYNGYYLWRGANSFLFIVVNNTTALAGYLLDHTLRACYWDGDKWWRFHEAGT